MVAKFELLPRNDRRTFEPSITDLSESFGAEVEKEAVRWRIRSMKDLTGEALLGDTDGDGVPLWDPALVCRECRPGIALPPAAVCSSPSDSSSESLETAGDGARIDLSTSSESYSKSLS